MTTPRASRRLALALISAGLLAGLPAVSRGQPAKTPAAPSPLVEAGKQVTTAEKALVDAQKHLQTAKAKISSQFAVKPEWAKAKQAYDKAKFDEEKARTATLGTLEKQADYKAAKAARAAADQKYLTLQNSGKASGDEFAKVAQEKLDRGLALKNMEKQALDNDAKYLDAKSKLTQAEQEWSGLQAQVDQAAQTDPDCLQAQQEIEQANQALAQARQNRAQVAKGIADAKAAEAKAKAESQKMSRSGPGGLGGGGGRYFQSGGNR